jgi:hypothetical protein
MTRGFMASDLEGIPGPRSRARAPVCVRLLLWASFVVQVGQLVAKGATCGGSN